MAMPSYLTNSFRAITRQGFEYLKPSSYRVTHRMRTANDLTKFADQYDLILLDRDCAISRYHGPAIEPEFRETLERIAAKSEIISNSSFAEFLRIGDIYSDLIPVSKLVKLKDYDTTKDVLLRIDHQQMDVINADSLVVMDTLYLPKHDLSKAKRVDVTFGRHIADEYTKPDPLPLIAVIRYRRQDAAATNVLMFGDRYLTDVMAGNLCGVDTAKVRSYKPLSEWKKPALFFMRPIDASTGFVMSRIPRGARNGKRV
jgi:hypothetical protein